MDDIDQPTNSISQSVPDLLRSTSIFNLQATQNFVPAVACLTSVSRRIEDFKNRSSASPTVINRMCASRLGVHIVCGNGSVSLFNHFAHLQRLSLGIWIETKAIANRQHPRRVLLKWIIYI